MTKYITIEKIEAYEQLKKNTKEAWQNLVEAQKTDNVSVIRTNIKKYETACKEEGDFFNEHLSPQRES